MILNKLTSDVWTSFLSRNRIWWCAGGAISARVHGGWRSAGRLTAILRNAGGRPRRQVRRDECVQSAMETGRCHYRQSRRRQGDPGCKSFKIAQAAEEPCHSMIRQWKVNTDSSTELAIGFLRGIALQYLSKLLYRIADIPSRRRLRSSTSDDLFVPSSRLVRRRSVVRSLLPSHGFGTLYPTTSHLYHLFSFSAIN